jgi:hypothetical protein
MKPESRKILRLLSDHILEPEIGNYLLSEQFTRFCAAQDIEDIWSASLALSRDKPQLYGGDVAKNAFFEVLQHIYHSRKNEFPTILSALLADVSGKHPAPSSVSQIQEDLIRLGYSREDVEKAFLTGRIHTDYPKSPHHPSEPEH